MRGHNNDDFIPIGDAPEHFPRQPNNKKVNRSTIYRWTTRGVMNRDKTQRITLRVLKIGGRTFTTETAIIEFIRKLNGEGGTDEEQRGDDPWFGWDDGLEGGTTVRTGPKKPKYPGGLSARAETAEQEAQRIVGPPQKAIRREFAGFSKPTPHSDDTGIATWTLRSVWALSNASLLHHVEKDSGVLTVNIRAIEGVLSMILQAMDRHGITATRFDCTSCDQIHGERWMQWKIWVEKSRVSRGTLRSAFDDAFEFMAESGCDKPSRELEVHARSTA